MKKLLALLLAGLFCLSLAACAPAPSETGKPEEASGSSEEESRAEAFPAKEGRPDSDTICRLYRQALENFYACNLPDLPQTAEKLLPGIRVDRSRTVTLNHALYYPTDASYRALEEAYGKTLHEAAFHAFADPYFTWDQDGALYVSAAAGTAGHRVQKLQVTYQGEKNGLYSYAAAFETVQGRGREIKTTFQVAVVDGAYRLYQAAAFPAGEGIPDNEEIRRLYEQALTRLYACSTYDMTLEVTALGPKVKVLYEEERTINGQHYYKTNAAYADAVAHYADLYAGPLLQQFLDTYFHDEQGELYVIAAGGATGYLPYDLQVTYLGEKDGIYTYRAVFQIPQNLGTHQETTFKVSVVNGAYRICASDLFPKPAR